MSTESPALKIMSMFWNNVPRGSSWAIINNAMRAALRLIVGSHIPVCADDLEQVYAKFGAGHWLGAEGLDPVYSLAVGSGNMSAAKAIESVLGRDAFIVDDVDPPPGCGGCAHRSGSKKRGRVAVRSRFCWKGEMVEVTSIDKKHFVACQRGDEKRKVIKITRKDILADRKSRTS